MTGHQKFAALAATICLLGTAAAQRSSGFIKAGANIANVSVTKDGRVNDAASLTSIQVGFMGDLPLTGFFSIQPGLYFTGKGSKTESGNQGGATYFRATSNPFYIEIPVLATFKWAVQSGKFFAGAGPYIAMGVAGKNKTEGRYLGVAFTSEKSIQFSNDDPSTNYEEGAGLGIMKRFDYGINATVGFEGKKALLSVNYGLGMAKLQSGATNGADNNNKHRVLSITLGFRL